MKDERKRIAFLNLMPMKEEAELDIRRVLSGVEFALMKMRSHVSRHASAEYMERSCCFFDEMCDESFDGLIVNGAPVEVLPFEEVDYWEELCEVFAWARQREMPALYICWGAQAALHSLYGIDKYRLKRKMFGVFLEKLLVPEHPIFEGFSRNVWMPHSRHTEIRREDIVEHRELLLLAEGEETGVSIVASRDGREVFVTGHWEYSVGRLDWEYQRDKEKRDDVDIPVNYYKDESSLSQPVFRWKDDALRFFDNWQKCL